MKRLAYYLVCLAIAVLSFSNFAHAQASKAKTRGLAVVADEQKRSVVVKATGTATAQGGAGGTQITPEQEGALKAAALNAAKKAALQKGLEAAQKLDADAVLVSNEDSLGILSTHFGGVEDNKITAMIMAEVAYQGKDTPTSDPATAKNDAEVWTAVVTEPSLGVDEKGPLTVLIWTDKKQYSKDEMITVYVKGNKDFYGRFTYEDADGMIIQILPNMFRQENAFKAGQKIQIPSGGDRFKFKVTAPFGEERFTVFASTTPIKPDGDAKADPKSGLSPLPEKREQVAAKTRGLAVVEDNDKVAENAPAKEIFEAAWKIKTVP